MPAFFITSRTAASTSLLVLKLYLPLEALRTLKLVVLGGLAFFKVMISSSLISVLRGLASFFADSTASFAALKIADAFVWKLLLHRLFYLLYCGVFILFYCLGVPSSAIIFLSSSRIPFLVFCHFPTYLDFIINIKVYKAFPCQMVSSMLAYCE